MQSQDDGFTLIELLIVIAIIAILVSIVAINVTGVMEGVTETAMNAERSVVQLAIDKYNTWNVAVKGDPVITGGGPTKLSPSSGGFAQYLASETRYQYTWGADGTGLTVSP